MAKSVYEQILRRAKDVIAELDLPGRPSVVIRKRGSAVGRSASRNPFKNGIAIVQMKRVPGGGTNERDQWGFQFGVLASQGTSTDQLPQDSMMLQWEDRILRRLSSGRLLNLSVCELHMTVTEADLPEDMPLADGQEAIFFVATVWVRQPRIEPELV